MRDKIDFSLHSGMMALAYLNSKTFEILRSGEIAPPALWFYVDDRLAETIQALNLRGYPTTGCRIDPPFAHRFQVTLINVRDSEGKTPAPADIARAYEHRTPDARVIRIAQIGNRKYRLTVQAKTPREICITFRGSAQFREIPEGCEYNSNVLRYSFPNEIDGLEYLQLCQTHAQALYDWACALPVGLW